MHENIERSILITRSGLDYVLYESIKNDVNILFDTKISRLEEKSEKTKVTFSNESSIDVHLVVVSEGLRFSARERYFTNYQVEDFNEIPCIGFRAIYNKDCYTFLSKNLRQCCKELVCQPKETNLRKCGKIKAVS